MEFSVRGYREPDFDTLWRIDQECFTPGISYSREELAEYMHRNEAFALVAEKVSGGDRSEILGFIVAEAGSRGNGHIITIDVLPQARKIGVGSQMLRMAEKRLLDAGGSTVTLEAAINNGAALAFYKIHGYSAMKTIPGYYSDGGNALVMKKDLLSAARPDKLPQ